MSILLSLVLALTLVNTLAIAVLAAKEFRTLGIKRVIKPSTELADFLDDIKSHGYGVIRLDPDTLMARGPRR
jgi:hypothetical protein